MKNLKKIMLTLLALVMSLAMATAFAEATIGESDDTLGSITINGVGESTTYEIYQMLDLESFDTTAGAYSYKINSAWTALFETEAIKQYMAVDENGYVTWVGGDSAEAAAAFARSALAFAQEHDIAPVRSSTIAGQFVITGTTGKFSNLPLGYYLVDSTMGALCGLTTTNPDASINAKNGQPTIDKTVQEDSTLQWGDQNTADVGQTVNFRTTINVHAGAENYVLHDTMSAGLTFNPDSIEIRHVVPGTTDETGTLVDTEYYTVAVSTEDKPLEDGCTFEITFTKAFCDHLDMNDKVIVYYSAMLNRNAIVSGDGNPNSSHLDYGDGNTTTPDSTKTYTFGFDLVKTDSQNTLINGAEFKIYDAVTGGNEVAVVLMEDGKTYRRARADEAGVPIVVKNGQVRVVGFDNGTYYLEETEAPDGYNKLTARQKFIIADANLDAVFNDNIFSSGSGVHVINKTGTMLPETGGIGTTIFYVFGGMMVAAAVVLLITRKRMSAA